VPDGSNGEYRQEDPGYKAEREEYEDRELDGGKDEGYRHREHKYESEYEGTVLEYKDMGRDNGAYRPHEPEDKDNKAGEPEWFEPMANEWTYKLQGLEC
jgi:hypothetical protein